MELSGARGNAKGNAFHIGRLFVILVGGGIRGTCGHQDKKCKRGALSLTAQTFSIKTRMWHDCKSCHPALPRRRRAMRRTLTDCSRCVTFSGPMRGEPIRNPYWVGLRRGLDFPRMLSHRLGEA
eukprot:4549748-Pyramimonas_sp.AAC.1